MEGREFSELARENAMAFMDKRSVNEKTAGF